MTSSCYENKPVSVYRYTRSSRPQFHLKSLFGLVTGFCVFFAIVSALGLPPDHVIGSVLTMAAFAGACVALIELCRSGKQ